MQSWQQGGKDGSKNGKDKAKGGGKANDWPAQQAQQAQQNAAKLQQLQQQQEELKKKAEEEKKKLEEAAVKKKAEQTAALAIRRVIQKVRGSTDDTLQQLKTELSESMAKELETCGSMKEKVKEEADKAVEQTTARLEAAKKAKEDAEAKRKEMQEKAEALLAKMGELVTDAEAAAKEVKEAAEPLSKEGANLKSVTAAAEAVEEVSVEAKSKLKLCTDFMKENSKDMNVMKKEGETDIKAEWGKLMTRTNESAKDTDSTVRSASTAKVKAVKKSEATKKLDDRKKVFDKYDKDKDGFLSKAEVKSYAKGVFKFDIKAEPLSDIFTALAEDPKGIKKELFQRLKVAVACAFDKTKDDALRKVREDKEAELAKVKAGLQEKLQEVLQVIEKCEELVKKAEAAASPLPAKAKELKATEMLQLADETDAAIKEARDSLGGPKTELEGLKEGVEVELKAWMLAEVSKLEKRTKSWENRLTGATNRCAGFRENARNKERAELATLEKQALGMIRYHQQDSKLSKDAMFEQFDADKDGSVSEADFLKFFAACKKEEPKEEDGKTAPKKDPPSEAELARVFKHLDEDDEGTISKDRLLVLIRRLMKVSSETALCSGMSIKDKDTKTLRRMEVNEVVEVLEGPIEDDSAGVMRVRAMAMKDGVEGWVTLKGNQGTLYLKDGGSLYKVAKETIMTAAFELDAVADKDASKKVKDPTRKLKEGELLEVREFPKKEEKSGLTRMKCRAKSDGLVGWVTTVGNAGTVFVTLQ